MAMSAKKPKGSGVPKKETPATRAKAKKFEADKARKVPGAPAGRGASVAASKKNIKGTVTRGKSNPVLEAMRNAANSLTTNREKAINEEYWKNGGNRPKTKPKGK